MKQNADDAAEHGTRVQGEASHFAQLAEAEVMAIRADPRNRQVIAADYGVTPGTIDHIRRGHTWKHLL